jgi:hypothetical protein
VGACATRSVRRSAGAAGCHPGAAQAPRGLTRPTRAGEPGRGPHATGPR